MDRAGSPSDLPALRATPAGDAIRVLHVAPATGSAVGDALERADDRLVVETATGAADALERLAGGGVEAVVSHYILPGDDGIDLLRAVRERDERLPFVLLVADGSESTASRAISAGVTDYRHAPAEGEAGAYGDLAERVVDAVRTHRRRQTERRALELAETTTDVLWMFDRDWEELLFVNGAYEALWGRPVDGLFEDARDFLDGIHPDDRERVTEAMAALSAGTPQDVEYRVNADEEYGRWVWVQGYPIPGDGEDRDRVAGFARDVTERKTREQELRRKNERLDEFAGVVSHDLRNPLNIAVGRLEMARERCEDEGVCEQLRAVARALDRMDRRLEDVLTLARQGETVDDVDDTDLAAVAADHWAAVETGHADLRVRIEKRAMADETRLGELFENLFANSVEHGSTSPRSQARGDESGDGDEGVTVTVGPLPEGFYVADDGPGIPPDEREAVFEAGYSTSDGGTGFGLSIVDEIAEAHGWEVEVTESEAGGARFEFRGVERPGERR